MQAVAQFIGRFLAGVALLLTTLIFEILLAMAVYVYLQTQHEELFGQLVLYARDALNWILDLFESTAPDLLQLASTSIAGDLTPKAFLLLFIGLFASGLIRAVSWSFRRIMRRTASQRG